MEEVEFMIKTFRMKRTKTPSITSFFPKRHQTANAQNQRSSSPIDEPETEIEEPRDSETEIAPTSIYPEDPILDSKEKDAAFCFVCYLFKSDSVSGGEAFVNKGFRAWSKTDAFNKHVGNHMSAHNNAMKNFDVFNKQKSSIACCFENYTKEAKSDYRIRLEASIDALRFITLQGLASRGHDESDESLNQGNFLELRKTFAKRNSDVARALFDKRVPGNYTLTSSTIQKEIVSVFANETTKRVIEELDGGLFGILADESADISDKEQMALCLRFVDEIGQVKERFLGVVHVGNTTSLTLKAAIEKLLGANSLTLSSVRGQGYDGAQLRLTLVAIAKKNADCSVLFYSLANLLNVITHSCKRKDILREKQAENVLKALQKGELVSGTGLNQEKGLSRPGDTRWGSHFKTILHVFDLFPSILEVLDAIGEFCDGSELVKVESLAFTMRTFDFVFIRQLMITIFGITNTLSKVLQKKDQDIVNAMALVDATIKSSKKIREDGWTAHMEKVTSVCQKNEICIPIMSDMYVVPGRCRRGKKHVDNDHHFRIDVFLILVDQILQEIEDRFDERSKDLLICMSCFNIKIDKQRGQMKRKLKSNAKSKSTVKDRFSSFDIPNLVRLARFYPSDFSRLDLQHLEYQLGNFVEDVRNDDRFWNLESLNDLSMKLVETKKHLIIYLKVYLLLKLVLILPVATATVERAFSAMTYIKNKIRNSMGDDLLNDNLVTFIERDIFCKITTEELINHFQNMRTRRLRLE
ncbi:uncharacterized protein LOC141641910 [Silene latifolia]|uniref:uncharacterized protein LOC141641910 n=1 Tax=Silene latifolia TaxID=37657 RepID=UPI003D789E6F